MRHACLVAAAVAGIALLGSGTARAATLLYSFEGGTDGFGPNGGGTTVSQDTIGATDGTHSLKTSIVAGATFVGALTSNIPLGLTPPLPVEQVSFDYTLTDTFNTGFAVIGITVFGANPGLGQFGLQAQFAPLIHIDGQAPGTYTNATIPLTGATNPLDFTPNESYNQIFVASNPGPNQLIPTGFEFFFNKANTQPLTVYIDNVTTPVPEPVSMSAIGAGAMLLLGGRRRRM
jgi:hypothetical protein